MRHRIAYRLAGCLKFRVNGAVEKKLIRQTQLGEIVSRSTGTRQNTVHEGKVASAI
jgi:hypothetical protein